MVSQSMVPLLLCFFGIWDSNSLQSLLLPPGFMKMWKKCSGSNRAKSNTPGDNLSLRQETDLNSAPRLRVKFSAVTGF